MNEPECRVCGWIVDQKGQVSYMGQGRPERRIFLPCPQCLKKQQDILARQAEDSQSE